MGDGLGKGWVWTWEMGWERGWVGEGEGWVRDGRGVWRGRGLERGRDRERGWVGEGEGWVREGRGLGRERVRKGEGRERYGLGKEDMLQAKKTCHNILKIGHFVDTLIPENDDLSISTSYKLS